MGILSKATSQARFVVPEKWWSWGYQGAWLNTESGGTMKGGGEGQGQWRGTVVWQVSGVEEQGATRQ